MNQAQQMKRPEMRSPVNQPKEFNDDPFSDDTGFKMPKHDPYQVKSYGAPTTKLKEQLDAAESQPYSNQAQQKQGFNDFPVNQASSFNTTYQNRPNGNGFNNPYDDFSPNSISDSYSGSVNSAKKKKKKRPKNKTQTRQSQDTSGYASHQNSSNQMMHGGLNHMPGAFDTVPQNRQQMNGPNKMPINISTGNMMQSQFPNNPMKMPNQPFQQMTPQKDSRGSDDDPFKGIGFGNFGSSFKAPAFENKMSLFHLDEPQATQSNDFDDPFAEDTFSNMSASKTESQNMFTPQKGTNMSQSAKNAPSTQYNFENSQKKTQNNDNFAFDEINIDLGDLSLFESPMPKINQPPETQMKREMHSGMPLDSSRSNFSNQSNPQRNLNMGGFGNLNQSNMGNQRMNSPGFSNQDKRGQNMNSFGGADFSGMGLKKGDDFNMFNTTAPVKSTFQNQPHPNQIQRQPPGRNNSSQQMDFFEESKTGRSMQNQSNMMSLNNSQMSAEPQVIQRGGPPQDRSNNNFANNFNTAAPPMRNQPPPQRIGMDNIGGMGNTGHFGGGQQPMRPNNNMNPMGGFNDMPNQNNMLVPVDPFRVADASGFGMGSIAGGFNTMVPMKQKRQNPFAKKSKNTSQNFQTSFDLGGSGASGSQPSEFNDFFSHASSDFNKTSVPQNNPNMFSTMNNNNSGSMGLDIFGQMSKSSAQNKPGQQFNPFGDSNRNVSFGQPQNQNTGFNYSTGGGMGGGMGGNMGGQTHQNPASSGNDFDDLFS